MSRYVDEELREFVATRAGHICEYCLIHEEDTFFQCHVDHIVSIKHGGQTVAENLAYACAICNRKKGSDIGSMLLPKQKFTRFFNPRKDLWSHHFKLERVTITPFTNIAKVTVQILDFNNSERILERKTLITMGRYPPHSASAQMKK